MSDVFGLGQPRSREAELAIDAAKSLQLGSSPQGEAVQQVNSRLLEYLAPDDEILATVAFLCQAAWS